MEKKINVPDAYSLTECEFTDDPIMMEIYGYRRPRLRPPKNRPAIPRKPDIHEARTRIAPLGYYKSIEGKKPLPRVPCGNTKEVSSAPSKSKRRRNADARIKKHSKKITSQNQFSGMSQDHTVETRTTVLGKEYLEVVKSQKALPRMPQDNSKKARRTRKRMIPSEADLLDIMCEMYDVRTDSKETEETDTEDDANVATICPRFRNNVKPTKKIDLRKVLSGISQNNSSEVRRVSAGRGTILALASALRGALSNVRDDESYQEVCHTISRAGCTNRLEVAFGCENLTNILAKNSQCTDGHIQKQSEQVDHPEAVPKMFESESREAEEVSPWKEYDTSSESDTSETETEYAEQLKRKIEMFHREASLREPNHDSQRIDIPDLSIMKEDGNEERSRLIAKLRDYHLLLTQNIQPPEPEKTDIEIARERYEKTRNMPSRNKFPFRLRIKDVTAKEKVTNDFPRSGYYTELCDRFF